MANPARNPRTQDRCAVPGCDCPRQAAASEHCVNHAALLRRFATWLDGRADSPDVLSFDRDRSRLSRGLWRDV